MINLFLVGLFASSSYAGMAAGIQRADAVVLGQRLVANGNTNVVQNCVDDFCVVKWADNKSFVYVDPRARIKALAARGAKNLTADEKDELLDLLLELVLR